MSQIARQNNSSIERLIALGTEEKIRDVLNSMNGKYSLLKLAFLEEDFFENSSKEFLKRYPTERNRAAIIHLCAHRNFGLNGIKFRGRPSKLEYNKFTILAKEGCFFATRPKSESEKMLKARILEAKKEKSNALSELECLQGINYYRESILFFMRAGKKDEALQILNRALTLHPYKEIFWQLKLQLIDDPEDENKFLECYAQADSRLSNKSGILCEFARHLMNPNSKMYDLEIAEQLLDRAIELNEKNGDAYIELLRLKKLKGESIESVVCDCIDKRPEYGIYWKMCENPYLRNTGYTIRRALEKLSGPVDSIGRSYDQMSCAFYVNHRSFHEQKKTGQLNQEAVEFLLS